MKFNTKTIHGGQIEEKGYGAVMPPIYQTSTYSQKSPGDHKGYEYSRTHNPTRSALEKSLASIESGEFGLAFGSGLAAIDAVLKLLNPGDEVISTNDLYGGSYRLFTKIFEKYGLVFHFTEMDNLSKIESLVNNNTKMIWVETPTNPMMNIVDINGLSSISKKFNWNFSCNPRINEAIDINRFVKAIINKETVENNKAGVPMLNSILLIILIE